MGRVHEIAVASETGAFEKGIKSGVIEPLNDAEKALKKLGDTNVGRDIDRDLDAAQRATKNLKAETKDAADAIEDAFRRSYKKAKGDADDATDKMKHGFREVGEEAGSSGREAAASFSGGFDDVADFIQETAANAFGGFGPIGAAAGLAAAIGLGIATAKIEELTEKVESLQQVASEVHMSALENDQTVEQFATSVDGATAALQRMNEEGQKKFRFFWEEDSTGLQEFNDDLKRAGETQADALDIFQLSTDQMEDYRDAVRDNADQLRDQADAIREAERGMGTLSDADLERISSLDKQAEAGDRIVESLEREIETRSEASERSNAWADSGAQAAQKMAEAEKTAADERASAEEAARDRITASVEAVKNSQLGAYDSMRDAAYNKATADNQAFDTDRWLQYVEETRGAADAYRANIATMQLSPAEWENLLALPEGARASIAASYAGAGEEGKARIRAALGDGGAGEAGSEATVSFEDAFDPKADVKVTADTSKSEADIDRLTKPRELPVKVVLDTSALDRWRPPVRDAEVRAVVDKSAWNNWTPPAKTGRVNVGGM